MTSAVWDHYEKVIEDKKITGAVCKTCGDKLKYSTSGMKYHTSTKHQIVINLGGHPTQSSTNQPNNVQRIDNFFPLIKRKSLSEILARLCAQDGLAFSLIAKSSTISPMISKLGFGDTPSSPETVRKYVMDYAEKVKENYKVELNKAKQEVGLLSISFDEWTSLKNRRYLNLIVHSHNSMWDLGLVRILGHTNSELTIIDITTRLEEFNLAMGDIIGMMADGASINGAIADRLGISNQKCLAHGLQLAIKSTFYNENSNSFEDEYDELGQLAFDDEEEDYEFKNENIRAMIKKVRKTSTLFRKSAVKNDELQKCVKSEFGKELNLIKDCPTRWNSLVLMLDRFYELRFCVTQTLMKLESEISFSREELDSVKMLADSLKPVQACILVICKKTCTLYEAHCSIEVALDELKLLNTEMSIELMKNVIEQLQTRFSTFYYLQIYLEDKNLVNEPQYFQKPDTYLFENMKTDLYQLLEYADDDPHMEDELDENDNLAAIVEPLSNKRKINYNDQFYTKIEAKKQKTSQPATSLKDRLALEFKVFEKSGHRGTLLSKLLLITKTLRPTSCDCERAFSVAGLFCNKLRSNMTDNTLSNLCLLKSFFNNHFNG